LQLVDAVEHAGAWCSLDCADFLHGLAFTGCRKGEARRITWHDVDFDAGEIIVRGDPETATKNWTVRREHSIAQAQHVTFTPVVTEQADVIAFPATAADRCGASWRKRLRISVSLAVVTLVLGVNTTVK
jgi:hypothetical protein